jgi:hypothetical protein
VRVRSPTNPIIHPCNCCIALVIATNFMGE